MGGAGGVGPVTERASVGRPPPLTVCAEHASAGRRFCHTAFQQPVFVHIGDFSPFFPFSFSLFSLPSFLPPPPPPFYNRERRSRTKHPAQPLARPSRQPPRSRARQVMWSALLPGPLGRRWAAGLVLSSGSPRWGRGGGARGERVSRKLEPRGRGGEEVPVQLRVSRFMCGWRPAECR